MIILGTNILRQLGLRVLNEDGSIDYLAGSSTGTQKHYCHAKVTQRTYISQGGVKTVTVQCDKVGTACVLWSESEYIGNGTCQPNEQGNVEIPVMNTSAEPLILQKGQVVGNLENVDWLESKYLKSASNLLELLPTSESDAVDGQSSLPL